MSEYKKPIPVYFTSLYINNVRCFGDQELDLTNDNGLPAQWTLIIGENGVGKTTLLQCLAWMRLLPQSGFETGGQEETADTSQPPPITRGTLAPAILDEQNELFESLLRVGDETEFSLGASLSFGGTLSRYADNSAIRGGRGKLIRPRVQASFSNRGLLDNVKPSGRPRVERTLNGEFYEPVVVAYGANRQLGYQNLNTGDIDDPIASRLSGVTELYDIEEMLSSLHYASLFSSSSPESTRLDQLKRVLARILPRDDFNADHIEIRPPDVLDRGIDGGVRLRTEFGSIPLSALSLGYQTTMAWAADLAWRLLQRYGESPTPLEEPAVVLIDEIDLHLHPRWQIRIMDDLSEVFRGTQFIATSHSPLMVQVAEAANFVLLNQSDAEVEIINDPGVVRSWRVDQILASELFRIPARSKQTELLFTRRDELAARPSRSQEDEVELESLRYRISQIPTTEDPEDQRAMDLIREAADLLKKHGIVGT